MEVAGQGRNWGSNPCPSLGSHSQSSEDLGLWFPLCLLLLIIPWEGEKTCREKEEKRQKESGRQRKRFLYPAVDWQDSGLSLKCLMCRLTSKAKLYLFFSKHTVSISLCICVRMCLCVCVQVPECVKIYLLSSVRPTGCSLSKSQ